MSLSSASSFGGLATSRSTFAEGILEPGPVEAALHSLSISASRWGDNLVATTAAAPSSQQQYPSSVQPSARDGSLALEAEQRRRTTAGQLHGNGAGADTRRVSLSKSQIQQHQQLQVRRALSAGGMRRSPSASPSGAPRHLFQRAASPSPSATEFMLDSLQLAGSSALSGRPQAQHATKATVDAKTKATFHFQLPPARKHHWSFNT